MGHDLQTPLLDGEGGQQPSAPALQAYPDVPAPGAHASYQGHATGIPTLPPQQQQHFNPMQAFRPATPPTGYPLPPAQAVIEQHTYLQAPEDPALTRISPCPHLYHCPACHSTARTTVRRESGCCAWVGAGVTFWLCCPLFWLPFCLDCDKDLVHRCSVCGTEVARVQPWR